MIDLLGAEGKGPEVRALVRDVDQAELGYACPGERDERRRAADGVCGPGYVCQADGRRSLTKLQCPVITSSIEAVRSKRQRSEATHVRL